MNSKGEQKWNELLNKYKEGRITESERFALEKQALDDPFLFDAMEGFALYGSANNNKKKSTIFTIPRLAAAASLVGLVALVVFMKNNVNNSGITESDTYAMQTEVAEQTDDTENDQIAEVLLNTEVEGNTAQEEKELVITTAENESKAKTKTSSNPPQKRSERNILDQNKNEKKTEVEEKKEIQDKIDSYLNSNKTRVRAKAKMPTQLKQIEGQVLDQQGNALVGALVVDQTSGNSTSVDEDGTFNLKVNQDTGNLLAQYNGYESQVLSMEKRVGNMNFTLAEASAGFKEIPSVSDAFSRENVTEEVVFDDASSNSISINPIIGKSIFEDYIAEKIDKRGLRQNPSLQVIIQFYIDKNGQISKFRQLTTKCPECSAFAISLLQESGEWKASVKEYEGIGTYEFTF